MSATRRVAVGYSPVVGSAAMSAREKTPSCIGSGLFVRGVRHFPVRGAGVAQRGRPPVQIFEKRFEARHEWLEHLIRVRSTANVHEVLAEYVDGRPYRCHVELVGNLAKLFDGACATHVAVAEEGDGLAIPLDEVVVERVLE